MSIFNLLIIKNDAPEAWQLGFQDPATPVAAGMISFHHFLMFVLIIIGVGTFWLLYRSVSLFSSDKHPEPKTWTHSAPLEVIWTIIPALVLLMIAGPSFSLLYSLDEAIKPDLTLKAIGNQWYWSYEYSDLASSKRDLSSDEESVDNTISFESYMLPESDLALGQLRLLEVDNRVALPVKKHIRVLITSADVLHSWAVPSFGIKVDACPGRISQASLFILREGIYYGQCSEICGVNHGFMPIVVDVRSVEAFSDWRESNYDE
jgi:cytochrome c oxidase subunit 2